MPGNRQLYTTLGGVAIFLFVIFSIIYFWGPKEQVSKSSSSAVPTTSTSSSTAITTTNGQPERRPASVVIGELMYVPYSDPENRFTFDYPLGWRVTPNAGSGVLVEITNTLGDYVRDQTGALTNNKLFADIVVLSERTSLPSSEEYANAAYTQIAPLNRREVIVSGIPASLADLEVPSGVARDALYHLRQLIVVRNGVAYMIQTRAYAGAWLQYEKTFTKVLGSFRLLP